MKIERKALVQVFLGVAACIFLYFLLHETERVSAVWNVLSGVFSPFIAGAAIAFILNVPMRSVERWLGIKNSGVRRLVALLITLAALILVLALVFGLLIPQISLTIQTLIPKIVNFLKSVQASIQAFLSNNPQLMEWIYANTELETTIENINWSSLIQQVLTMLKNSVSTIAGGAVSVIGSISGAVVDAVIGLVFGIYCLFRKEILARQGRRLLYAFVPEKASDEVVRIFRLTNATFSSFISGQCLEACILGCMFAVVMAILGMPYIPLISVLIAVTSLVPLVGAFVGCFFGAFFILVDSPVMALWFVVIFLVIQQIEGNLVYPKVVGTSIGLPGMWVLVAVAIGGELMGVAGMLLMIPLTSVVYTLLREITDHRLNKRKISPDKLQEQPLETGRKAKQEKNVPQAESDETQSTQ